MAERKTDDTSLLREGKQRGRHCGNKSASPLQRCSDLLVSYMEAAFLRLGSLIGNNPWKSICIAVVTSFLFGIGMVKFNMDGSPETLWNPIGSDIDTNQRWVDARFPTKSRFSSIIAEDDNVLTPAGLLKLLKLYQAVLRIKSGTIYDWKSLCFRQASVCVTGSLLDLWRYNETTIRNLTTQDILHKINQPLLTRADGRPIDLTKYLGEISKNSNNTIIGAKAFFAFWALKNDEKYSKQTGFAKDETAGKWEKEFGLLFKKEKFGFKKVSPISRSAQNNAANAAMQSDVLILSAGYMLMIIYASFMLGKFNRLKNKIWLGSIAVLCVILSILVSCGVSSIFNFPYGPLHNILPFLVLGIGVDDAFVIAHSWQIASRKSKQNAPIHELAAETMKNAGISITVTSLTDFIAFGIGATTILPALRSFCIYCGFAILALYVFSCTIFLACLCLDTKREREHKDAFLCCLKLDENYSGSKCSEKNFLQRAFDYIGENILSSKWMNVLVLLFTALIFAVSCFALTKLKQEYRFEWWLPVDSPPRKYIQVKAKYFPAEGLPTAVYISDLNYFQEHEKLTALCTKIKDGKYIVKSSVLCWYPNLIQWTLKMNRTLLDKAENFRNESSFMSMLERFISSKQGQFFVSDLIFSKGPGKKRVTASRYRATHIEVYSSQDEVNAMDEIKGIAKDAGFKTGRAFAFSKQYLYLLWETNKIIKNELFRNIALASAAVFLVTLFLVANLWMSTMIFTCVILSLINVAGMMYFWGLTIETVTSVCLILSIGLCVDYSAHIGHAYMTSTKGTRHARSAEALSNIGPAVLNGGVSTCLAFLLLAFSNSYGFKTFFKVFFLVVVFGLYHGLVFFPVLLGLIGPSPYHVVNGNTSVQSKEYIVKTDEDNGDKDSPETQQLTSTDDDVPETTL